ncbi:MAG: MXAN_6640 family putative metalloprotease, partial [Bacteroidota bacterium]
MRRCARIVVLLFLPILTESAGTAAGRLPGVALREEGLSRLGLLDPASGAAKCGFPLLAFASERRDAHPREGAGAYAALLVRPATQMSILRDGVRVHYDTAGAHAPALLDGSFVRIPGTSHAYAESVAAICASVARRQTQELGYAAPPPDGGSGGGDEYDVYVQELGALYGETAPETNLGGRRYTTFMTIDNDFVFVSPAANRGLPALRVTLAHEYHHAVQLGGYGYWGYPHIAYYEMSCVWMEDVLYPEVNDYLVYVRSSLGHFRHPHVPFPSTDIIMYSRGIWCHFLAARFAGDLMRRSWEWMAAVPPLAALDRTLREAPYQTGFQSAFAEWALWNYYTGGRADSLHYPEGREYPEVFQEPAAFTPPARRIEGALGPLAARYHQTPQTPDTLTLALANLDLDRAAAGDETESPYALILNVERPDPGYVPTGSGLFVKLEVADPGLWHNWSLVRGGIPLSLA